MSRTYRRKNKVLNWEDRCYIDYRLGKQGMARLTDDEFKSIDDRLRKRVLTDGYWDSHSEVRYWKSLTSRRSRQEAHREIHKYFHDGDHEVVITKPNKLNKCKLYWD